MKAVFWKENGVYVGSLVEYDIVSQGDTLDQAKDSLAFSVRAEKAIAGDHGEELFEDVSEAPEALVGHLFDIGDPIEGNDVLSECRLSEMDLQGMQFMAKYFGAPLDVVEACCYRENIPINDDGGYC